MDEPDPQVASDEFDALYRQAFVAEVAKKAGLLWVIYADRWHPVWHVWHEGSVCVVAGGDEQPLPQIREQDEVVLDLRAKSTRAAVAKVRASVEVLGPDHDDHDAVVEALTAGRLNLFDGEQAPQRWARECTIVRFTPTDLIAAPGHLDESAQREQPIPSPAVTADSRPFSLHRQRRIPRLSTD
ncbi:hypothetical protein [Mumia flava]|nr:hypothetical protein [Mumia flava]